MTFNLDNAFPYPWHEPAAQQLHVTLYQLYPNVSAATNVAQRSGINIYAINIQQAPAYVWMEILNAAGTAGLTRTLVGIVHDLLSPNSPCRPFLRDLLANEPVQTETEPLGLYGAPNFIINNDDVTEPEALLYYDDLTIQIGRVPGLIATLQRLVTLAPSVCKLVVDIHGSGQSGTGFRIGPDLLLTNWHVLHNKNDGTRATTVSAEFGYEDDGSGGILEPTVISCDEGSIVTSKADDWAVICTKQPLVAAWPVIKLSEAVVPAMGVAAYIVQHPGGERKRLGFVRNQVSFFDDRVVHYLTDTKEGSSGSPVFDAQGQLIALHHAGGRPQEVLGRVPLKKNEGIRISRVIDGLKGQNIIVP